MLKLKKCTVFALIILNLITISAFGASKTDEIDTLRASLSIQKNKTSQEYIKTKEKLDKLIAQSELDYSAKGRINDVLRLINEKKYSSATYELNDMIENNIEVSICNELLATIYSKTSDNTTKVVYYLKKAVAADNNNISATFKLAKLYLKERKNILGTEYLKKVVELSKTTKYFPEIENIVLNNVYPKNKYEANNFYETLGNMYFKSGRNLDSYSALNKAIELNPEDIALKYQLANILYSNNEADSALSLYASILNQNPNDSQIRNAKAKILFKKGNIINAEKEYLIILKQYPDSNQAKYGIYQIYRTTLSPKEIMYKIHSDNQKYTPNKNEIVTFIQFLNEIGDYEAANAFISYLNELKEQQQNLTKNEQETKIIKEQEPIKKQIASSEPIKVQLQEPATGTVQPAKKEMYTAQPAKKVQLQEQNKTITPSPAAKQEQNKLNRLQKEREKILLLEESPIKQKVTVRDETKKITESEEQIKQKEELEEKILEQKRQEAIKKEQEEKKIQEQKRIEKIEQQKKSDLEEAQKELKNAQKNTSSKYQQYKKTIDNYLNTKPMTSSIYTAVANTYKQAGMPYNAIKYYNEAKKLLPTDSDTYYNIGLAYMELNRLKDAKEYLTKSINLDSNNKKAQNLIAFVNQKIVTSIINSAYTDFERKKYIEAYATLDKGIKEMPNAAQLYYYRAIVGDAMNRNAAAIIDLQKTIELDPSYCMAYYYLGKSYEKINDEKSALVAYERFLSIEPEEEDLINEIQNKVIDLGKKYY